MNQPLFKSKYHREIPSRAFDPNQTLYDVVMQANADNMDQNYAIYFGKSATYSQLKAEADMLAAALQRDGVCPGDVVAVCVLTIPEAAALLLAINRIGAVSFWMDARTKPSDVEHYIRKSGARHVFVIEPVLGSFIGISGLRKIVIPTMNFLGEPLSADTAALDGIMSYREFMARGAGFEAIPCRFDKFKPGLIVQSSGSTGKSKAIVHTTYNINYAVQKFLYLDFPLFQGETSLLCVPPWVIYGLVCSLYLSLVAGMPSIFSLEYKSDVVYKYLGSFSISFGVPVCYRYLCDIMKKLQESGTEESLKRLKYIREKLSHSKLFISGGDKLIEQEHLDWQKVLNVPIANGYGNNEVVGAAIVSPMFANRPGSIGLPLYDTLVKAIDPDTGEILPDGAEGEIVISSDTLFMEYLSNPEETKKIKQFHDGRWWVHTGDLGRVDREGFVYLTGRTKRLIIDRLGYKISPENSENLIQRQPHVRECVVVGVEVAENDSVPMAFIELDAPDENGDILRTIEAACIMLKDYERPKFFKIIDSIPHKDNGGKRDFLTLEQIGRQYVQSLVG